MTGNPGGETVMTAGDYYNAHSQQQHNATTHGLPLLERAAGDVSLPAAGQPFLVADYGAAQGRNSLEPIRTILAAIRRRLPPPAPIAVVHTDLPANDFNALLTLLGDSPESYLRDAPDVYAFGAGKSFYEQIFPGGQVSLGYTASTVHWLSAAPCPLPGHIWPPSARGATHAAFAARARQDWHTFLACRSRELCPGGQLVVVAGLADPSGHCGLDGVMDLANEVLQELVAVGTLAADAYERMVLPMYYQTAEEFAAPFGPDAATGASPALRLVESQEVALSDVYWQQYEATRDAQAYAAAYTAYLRAFTEPTLFGTLGPAQHAPGPANLADVFYQRVQERIAAEPARVVSHWQILLLRVARPLIA
jgi:SAM dependent carboxyl methyltransferase